MASFWYVLLALQTLAAAAFYLRTQYHARRRSFWPMALLLCIATVALAVEYVSQKFGIRSMFTQLAQIATPLAMVLVGLRLLQQQGRALQAAEEGKAHLELRIREATAEIERNFTQLAELRVEKVTERERKRIAADLHDDLGAKLLTIVHTSDSERISTLAREALEEMRLSVRGLTGKPVQLIDALGDWRAEVVSRLGQAGIEADWSSPRRRTAADAVGPRLRADHAHPARGGQQRHQAQRLDPLLAELQHRRRRPADRGARQRQRHPDGAGRPPGPWPRHGQHEAPRQAVAGPVPGRIGPRLWNRDTPHASAEPRHRSSVGGC